MRIRTKTTGSFPRARVTLPLIALLAAGLSIGPALNRASHPDEATVLGMASTRGLIPIMAQPERGTEVFQWDPELADIAPTDLGKVTDPHAVFQGEHMVLVRNPNPHRPGLYILIQKGEMRYWVKKPQS